MNTMFWCNVGYFFVRFANKKIRNSTNDVGLKAFP